VDDTHGEEGIFDNQDRELSSFLEACRERPELWSRRRHPQENPHDGLYKILIDTFMGHEEA